MDKKVGIYCIENLVDHKRYIGQSIDIIERWKHHIKDLKRGNHHNIDLRESWIKYGNDNFNFYILKTCKPTELDFYEQYYIKLYNTTDSKNGYNLVSGGKSGFEISEITKERLKESRKGKLHTEECKRKMSEMRKGEKNAFYGKHHTEEAKEKMRKNHYDTSGENNPRFNPEPVICTTTGKIYSSAYAASKELGLYSSSIRKCCEGKLKTTGGLTFQFYNSSENNT